MTAEPIHVEPILSPAEDESEPIRRGLRRDQREVQPSDYEEPLNSYFILANRCRSRSHEYLVWTRAGYRCLWCRRIRPGGDGRSNLESPL